MEWDNFLFTGCVSCCRPSSGAALCLCVYSSWRTMKRFAPVHWDVTAQRERGRERTRGNKVNGKWGQKRKRKIGIRDCGSRFTCSVAVLHSVFFLMMNSSGMKDNRAIHVLNISVALLFLTRETSSLCQSCSVMKQAGRPLSFTDPPLSKDRRYKRERGS